MAKVTPCPSPHLCP